MGSEASADPIAVTSGHVIFLDDRPGSFRLVGSSFDLEGSIFDFDVIGTDPGARCAPCDPGTPIDFGRTTYRISDAHSRGPGLHRGVVAGVAFEQLFFEGELTFQGPRVVTPPKLEAVITAGPFTFEGRVAFFLEESLSGPPVFAGALFGFGTAGVGLELANRDFPEGPYCCVDLFYNFEDPTVIPEPATLALVGSGVAGIAVIHRRRRRGRSRLLGRT